MFKTHLKSAMDHIRRSPFQALAAVMIFSITFLVTTLLAIILYSSEQTLQFYEKRPQIIIFLKDDATETAVSSLQSKLQTDPRVENLEFITKESAYEIYKKNTSEYPLLSELVNPSTFPASIEFSPKDLIAAKELYGELKTESVADQVGYTGAIGDESELRDQLDRLKTATQYLRIGGITFAGLLTSTSFLVLLIIIGMRMNQHRNEIDILELIGATPGFVRLPILIEAVVYVLTGIFIGWMISLLVVLYATPSVISFFGSIPVLPKNTFALIQIFGIILGTEIITGLFLALTGSALALSRVKHKK